MNFGGLGLYTKLKNVLKSDYESDSYWIKRGMNYINETIPNNDLQIKGIIDYLKTITFDSILEIGCGYGRLTREINNTFKPKHYTALDLSETQISNAKKYIQNDNVEFINSTFENYYSDFKRFDLVFACEVFLHIEPEKIIDFMAKAILYSSKHVIHIDPLYVDHFKITKKQHDFNHDYKRLYRCADRIELTITPLLNQGIYHLVI